MVDLESVLTETKSLDTAPSWFVSADDTANFNLERMPLSINGITVPGIYLTGHCRRYEPDLDVFFTIICNIPKLYKGPLIRYEWNPKQSHSNKGRGKSAFKFMVFTETHIHPFDENFALGYKIMREDNLPIAYPVSNNPQNFREMLAEVGKLFDVDNIQTIQEPQFDPGLLI